MECTAKTIEQDLHKALFRHNTVCLAGIALISAASVASNLVLSWILQQVVDLATGAGNTLSLHELCLVSLLLLAGCAILTIFSSQLKPHFISQASYRYREYATSMLLKKKVIDLSKDDAAGILSALSNDLTVIETNYLMKMFSVISNFFLAVGAIIMMCCYSPLLTLVSVAFSFLPMIVSMLFSSKSAAGEKAQSEAMESFTSVIQEFLSGFGVIKKFQREKQAQDIMLKSSKELQNKRRKRLFYTIFIESLGSVASALAQLGVLLTGCYMALRGSGITGGTLVIFLNLMGSVVIFVSVFPDYAAGRKSALTLMERLANRLAKDLKDEGKAVPEDFDGNITVEHLSVQADGYAILHDVNASFPAGSCTAIVGPSGSGKSTLLKAIISRQSKDAVLYDETPVGDMNMERICCLVSQLDQNVFIFRGTIHDNITLWKHFEEKDIRNAERESDLSDVIKEKSESYLCGINGGKLSGGEKQRIALARCLLEKKPLLLLDEVVSALDERSANVVYGQILQKKDVTRIIVTHNLSSSFLSQCDNIIVMHQGRVEESGTYEALMQKEGMLYRLVHAAE